MTGGVMVAPILRRAAKAKWQEVKAFLTLGYQLRKKITVFAPHFPDLLDFF